MKNELYLRPKLSASSLPATRQSSWPQTNTNRSKASLAYLKSTKFREILEIREIRDAQLQNGLPVESCRQNLPCSYKKKGSESGLVHEIVVARFKTAFLRA
jgi:hypothetical protein